MPFAYTSACGNSLIFNLIGVSVLYRRKLKQWHRVNSPIHVTKAPVGNFFWRTLDSFCGRGSNMKNFKLKAVGYQIIPVVLWLNTSKIPQTLNGGHFTLSTSSGTNRLILLPWYDEHPRHFCKGVPPEYCHTTFLWQALLTHGLILNSFQS